jgi:hypothetical protein
MLSRGDKDMQAVVNSIQADTSEAVEQSDVGVESKEATRKGRKVTEDVFG